jgi:hypothetical protein
MSDTGSTGGIQIGDAIVNFIGDMSQLDQGVDKLNDRIESGMTRASQNVGQLGDALDTAGETATEAGGEIDEAMGKSTVNIREARGEAMLLGEAFGVHLPRHVTSFIATVPGVGEALSAAFSATAVLFVLDAVVKLTEKVTDFISTTMIYTDQMKAAEAALANLNAQHIKENELLAQAKLALDRVGESTKQLAIDRINDDSAKRVKELNDNLDKQNASLETQDSWLVKIGLSFRLNAAYAAHDAAEAAKIEAQQKNIADNKRDLDEEEQRRLTQIAAVEKQSALDVAEKKLEAERKYAAEVVRIISQVNEQELEASEKTAAAMQDALLKSFSPAAGFSFEVTLDKVSAGLAKATEAAHYFGQETRDELTQSVKVAVDNFMALQKEAGVTSVQLKNAGDQVLALQAKLNNFGKAPEDATKHLADLLDMTKQLSQAETGFGDAFGSAMAKVVTGEEGVGQAMKQATGAVIEQIGQRALVQGMYDLGMGFAALASLQPEVAAQYFEASAILLTVGAGATAGGAAISGSSGGANSGGSYNGTGVSGIQTSGSGGAPGPATTTTKLSAGGFVSSPTMVMIGDSVSGGPASEAVIPLDNPEVMEKLTSAFAAKIGGGPGGSHTFNGAFFGQLRHSDLKKLTRQINQAVNKGTATLNSTKTGRIVKRSA